ncbi:MAG: class I tRNA ligase family protein [Thaumarchaeota archaeon]|nr:class I tRNA ligase family protein [Nitrososphaerota archaeon]
MVTKLAPRSKEKDSLSSEYDWKKIESRVRKFYADPDVTKKIARSLSGTKPVGYVDGPPTLNNQPHVGHIRGRMMKDLWYRHRTLQGANIVFRGGWDTQGLPVELQAEKEMGLSGNKWEDLKAVGVERLVEGCKSLVEKYKKDWVEADELLGVMIDHERAYVTYLDSYIEREWKYLQTAWKAGILGEGFKVVPYCPSCQTALSAGEVALGGYEKLDDPSLYYKVRMPDGAYLALWTTMPFTVVTDELVGVKPESDYEYVRVGGETWVVCSERKEALSKELDVEFGETVKKVKGSDLEGFEYAHPLSDMIPGFSKPEYSGKIHRVVAEEYVDTTTGTGVVHISPANGEEDFGVATRRGVPVFAPFDDRVNFTEEAGRFAGMFARDADEKVIEALGEKGALLKAGRLVHDYPVCWRSGHRLIWLARREYFYWVDRLRDRLLKAAEKVEYFFESPRNRFLSSIGESPAWCITRERIWGTPLPIWVCQECGKKVGAFSRKKIVELALELPDGKDFELHRPWVDRVVLRCPECGGRAMREPFVLDTWHNSGSSPYASYSDEEYRRLVPVEFLTEGIDQTRGWAYTLLVLNVILSGKPVAPYRSFLFQGHVLDKEGTKMSKSLGNVIQGLELLRNNSADVSRFYITWKSSPEDSVSLDLSEMTGRPYQVLNTLYHLHVYLSQNGAVDGYDSQKHTVGWASARGHLTLVDRWLLSKLSSARKRVQDAYDSGRYNEAAKVLEGLVIIHVSQTYVRLVRSELWNDAPKERGRRLAIYAVLGYALRSLDEMMHPITPFCTEFLHQELFAAKGWTSPLLAGGTSKAVGVRAGAAAEGTVEFALTIEEACNSARTKARLKRRWPLKDLEVLVPARSAKVARSSRRTAASLCNVKAVTLMTSASKFPASFVLKPNPSKFGALFKERTREVLSAAKALEGDRAVGAYFSARPVRVTTGTGVFEVPVSAYILDVSPREGYEVGEKEGVFVAASKVRDRAMMAEGLVRDVARRLQALRKARGFKPTAMLGRAAVAGLEDEDLELLASIKKEIAFLVRVKEVSLGKEKTAEQRWFEDDLDGRPIFLDVG